MSTGRLYGDIWSGNCYKIYLLARHLELALDWRHVDILRGETRQPEFLARSAAGRVPLLELEDGQTLSESNAILNYLAAGSALLPSDSWRRAKVLQWQFFEQYSHEPYIAVARFLKFYLGLPKEQKARFERLQVRGYEALTIMDGQLAQTPFIAGDDFSIADISLYAYTHVAADGDFKLDRFPHLTAWLDRVAALPAHLSMAAAAEKLQQPAPSLPPKD